MPAPPRSRILALLQQHRAALAQRFGVQEIALFGSAARDELRADSDVDVLVGFMGAASYDSYFGLKDYLKQFVADEAAFDAVLFNLQVIGEAVRELPEALAEAAVKQQA